MSNFADPVCCGVSELSETDLKSKIQQCIADEYEAASRYRKISAVCKDKRVKEIMDDIANEEIVHVGEFHKLLDILFPEEMKLEEDGKEEAEKKIAAVVDAKETNETDEEESGKVCTKCLKEPCICKEEKPERKKIRVIRIIKGSETVKE